MKAVTESGCEDREEKAIQEILWKNFIEMDNYEENSSNTRNNKL